MNRVSGEGRNTLKLPFHDTKIDSKQKLGS